LVRDLFFGVERAGKPEAGEQAEVTEQGDVRDPVAFEREHDQAVRPANRRVRVGQVDTERRLAVWPAWTLAVLR
jgi:hypothetical protein